MFFDIYEYSICGHYLPAIINGDHSGLSDEEEAELNIFLDSVVGRLGGHWSVDSEEPSFMRDEVSGLMADCYDCTYNVPNYSDVISV